jgi:hypothetical protein
MQLAWYHNKLAPKPRPCTFCKQMFTPSEGWGKIKSCPVCHAIDPAKRQAMLYARHKERIGGKRLKVLDDTTGLVKTDNAPCCTRREGINRSTPEGFMAYFKDMPYLYETTFKESPTEENIKRRARLVAGESLSGFMSPAFAGRQVELRED